MAYMPLKIPRSTIPIGGFGERDNTGFTRAEMLDKAFDRSIFACRITALEYDKHPVVVLDDVALNLNQFDLELAERRFVTGMALAL